MHSNWYKSWFDSEYYHLLYDSRDDGEAKFFIDNVVKILEVQDNWKILDAPCGRGRHARYLNSLGYQVDAFDLSPSSIEFAQDYENSGLHFYVHDMTQPFKTNHYDLCLNLFTSFGYFEDPIMNQKVFRNLARNVKEKGILLIDYLSPDYVRRTLNTRKEIVEKNSVEYTIERRIEENKVVKHIQFYDRDNAEQGEYEERVSLIELDRFGEMAESTHLELDEVYGSYDFSSYDPQDSNRMIMIFR